MSSARQAQLAVRDKPPSSQSLQTSRMEGSRHSEKDCKQIGIQKMHQVVEGGLNTVMYVPAN